MSDQWLPLPLPPTWKPPARRAFLTLAESLATGILAAGQRPDVDTSLDPGLAAASHVLIDLVAQGWAVRCADQAVLVHPPDADPDAVAEKDRVRRQELLKRDEQLRTPSVQRFIREMEQPREYQGSFVSIFSLMRDGRQLADALEKVRTDPESLGGWRGAIDPYIHPVISGMRCDLTGMRLMDIWRYFRHTWTNQYTSTPGRTLYLLVRDRAAPFHPVIGIAALGSAIVQIRERDRWIGWQSDTFLAVLAEQPTLGWARWLMRRLDDSAAEIYRDDLIEDGLYWPSLWDAPTSDAIAKLREEAVVRRRDHHRFARAADFKGARSDDEWLDRAQSDLFRSKRCLAMADLLSARRALIPHLCPKPSRGGLQTALADPRGRRAIADILRRAKADAVGTEIADLTVCGAVAPYNQVLGGKLVSMLAVSPSAVRIYQERYGNYASEIASSLAGRPVRRRSNLVFVGTTSLYGSQVSQYNRLRLPATVLGSTRDIEFRRLGRSRSFGTSHLSADAVDALVRLTEQSQTGVRVNSIFGEGVNPKLRKIRSGLDLLGWPSEQLLQHRRQRVVYGVSLVDNLLPYLLGADEEPRYTFRRNVRDDVRRIGDWWFDRWMARRLEAEATGVGLRQHSLDRPVHHGARVVMPNDGDGDSAGESSSRTGASPR
jgi:hypothetical protein